MIAAVQQPQRRRALQAAATALWPLLGLLQACGSPPAVRGTEPWTQGRLLLRVEATPNQPAQSLSAAFELQGDSSRGELRLFSPLGTRLVTAAWSSLGAQLSTPQGERAFDNLEALAQEALGQAVPLAALPDWLAGRPWAGAGHQQRPQGFEQLGWAVNTARLAEGQLEAHRPAAPAVLLRVRLELP